MNQVHALKTLPEYFEVVGRVKPFEVRKNDRDFKVGDTLWLQEWSAVTGHTGRDKKFVISYVLNGHAGNFGIEEGYCVLGLRLDPVPVAREFKSE